MLQAAADAAEAEHVAREAQYAAQLAVAAAKAADLQARPSCNQVVIASLQSVIPLHALRHTHASAFIVSWYRECRCAGGARPV